MEYIYIFFNYSKEISYVLHYTSLMAFSDPFRFLD